MYALKKDKCTLDFKVGLGFKLPSWKSSINGFQLKLGSVRLMVLLDIG